MRVTTTLRSMGLTTALLVAVLFMTNATSATAGLSDVYKFEASTGSPIALTSPTNLFGWGYIYHNVSAPRPIGFDFYFDGTKYTTFSPNTSGLITLGRTAFRYSYNYYFPRSMASYSPAIMPFWDYLRYGQIRYQTVGTAPNRILVIDYNNFYGSSSLEDYYFQVRLYEGSNKIEFFYDRMYVYAYYKSATIGIQTNTSRWMNVYYGVRSTGGSPTVYDNTDNRYNTNFNPYFGNSLYYRGPNTYHIPDNALWTFNPCENNVTITGDMNNGGTEKMEPNDILVNDETVQRGSTGMLMPFSITNPSNGCGPVTYSASFSGAAAGDYSMTSGTVAKGETVVPEILFTPGAVGNRGATMTLSMSNGQRIVYNVAADGLTRINWIADIAQGGVADMPSGANLLTNIDVDRGSTRDLMPFMLANTNPDKLQFPADITIILDDPLDEYTLDLPGGAVVGGPNQ